MAESQETVDKSFRELLDKFKASSVHEVNQQPTASSGPNNSTDVPRDSKLDIAAYLGAALLDDTECYGLGMISMLKDTCVFLQTAWKDLRPLLLNRYSAGSCRRIDDFITKYIETGEIGWRWARIIDPGYLRGYTPRENEFVCIAFLAILEHARGPKVWQASWINYNCVFYSDAKARGRSIYRRIKAERKAKSRSDRS